MGQRTFSKVPLSAIIKNPFALSDLEYRDINIDTELSSATIHDTAVLKKIDWLSGNCQNREEEPARI